MTKRRVLIVSPHFPPVNAADMQRVRMLLPFFHDNGWEAEVLAVAAEQVAMLQDSWLVRGLPVDVKVHRIRVLGLGWSFIPWLGTLGLRGLWPLASAGVRLLAGGGFDLVYFSTTVFDLLLLGPRWKQKHDVPFVLDYQDPWVNDYYREHPNVVPPGGQLKYSIISAIHRRAEPRVLRHCLGITSVSPAYPKQLDDRYPWFQRVPRLVQPFPGAQRDFERVKHLKGCNRFFDASDGNIHWVYIGVVIEGMYPALRALFKAIKNAMPEAKLKRLRMHFIGTTYSASGTAGQRVLLLATEYGLTDQVVEQCDRIPYADALRCLTEADALLAIGSDDPGYTASKIYPYLLARKPLLAVYHENSSIISLIQAVGGAVCVPLSMPVDEAALAAEVERRWLLDRQYEKATTLDAAAFEPYTDQGCAQALCRFFERCLLHKDNAATQLEI
ncbi:MAG: hypothetical protein H7232_16625 [Aeromicrobium sp.]|nr:hypothetical protein [Burkholderiales bacterium]